MTDTEPRPVGDVPPGRRTEENPQGIEPDTEERIREREGEAEDEASPTGPADPPREGDDQGPSGPPHRSVRDR